MLFLPLITHCPAHKLCQPGDGKLLSGTQIHCLIPGIMIHQKQAGVCQIIHIQGIRWGAPVPQITTSGLFSGLSLMETPNQSRKHMGMLRMVIIIGAVEIGGHHADIIRSILPVQVFTIFQPGNLGQAYASLVCSRELVRRQLSGIGWGAILG